MCTCTHVAVPGRNRILLHILTMLSRSKHCSTELPLRVGLICTALIHGHLPGTATHIKVLHTPSPSRSLSFPLSYPHHILISYPLSFLPSSSPPLLLPYLHPPLPHSPLQRWSLGSLVNGPLINEVISWALPLQPLVFAVHGAPSLRPIIIVHRVQEVQTAATRLLKHSKWKYVILPNPNMHTHQTHSIHGLVHTLPPSLHSTQSLIRERLTITTTASTFWKNRSFAEHVLQEISSNCVDIKHRHRQWWQGTTPCQLVCKNLSDGWWPANKDIMILCVHIYKHNIIDNGVKPKGH